MRPAALTIAGSDSGGGAGIQADLRAFEANGCWGTCAITCVTAQNLNGVTAVEAIDPVLVQAQVRAALERFPVRAVKTGMLFSRDLIVAVAALAESPGFPPVVVDPVMVAASGSRLLQPEAETAYRELLFARAALVTPNLDEAAVILGRPVPDAAGMEDAAAELGRACGASVLLKGGHLPGRPVDVLWHAGVVTRWEGERILAVSTHGAGCTLSAAIAARLARGEDIPTACRNGREYLLAALREPATLQSGARLLGRPDLP